MKTSHLHKPDCILKIDAQLGEGPLWSPEKSLLYWVDIQEKKLHLFDPKKKQDRFFKLPQLVTTVALRKKGCLLTFPKQIVLFNEETETFEVIHEVEKDAPLTRFNDGKCDRLGRFWGGTINTKVPTNSGNLYRASKQEIAKAATDITFSNGLCWSPDNKTFFHVETFKRTIFAYDFDLPSGQLKNKRVFATIASDDGMPDGMTIDDQGGIWCAIYGGSKVIRFDKLGALSEVIQLPVPHVTCVTFGGDRYDTLFITTAQENLSKAELEKYPLSGSLFAIKLNYRGIPETPFAE